MKYYLVKINSNSGDIKSCELLTEAQYESWRTDPQMQHGSLEFFVEAKNPKDAQRTAQNDFRTIKDAVS